MPKPGTRDSPAKVYVEPSVLSRIADYLMKGAVGLRQGDKDALDHLCDQPSVDFVTSEKTLDEFLAASVPDLRLILKVVYKLTVKVRREPIQIRNPIIMRAEGRGSRIIAPASRIDPLFERLQRVLDRPDAEHVFQARKAECDYFLTTDAKTILNRAAGASKEQRQSWTPLEIVSPAQLWTIVQAWPDLEPLMAAPGSQPGSPGTSSAPLARPGGRA